MFQTQNLTDTIPAMTYYPAQTAEQLDWSFWSLCTDGCYFILPLLLLLLIAIYSIIERCVVLNASAKPDEGFCSRIWDYVHDNELESADNLCSKTNSPYSRIVQSGLKLLGRPMGEINDILNLSTRIEMKGIKRSTALLSFIAVVSPLAGLLGSAIGTMRIVFDATDAGNPVGSQVFLSLMTLAVGIIVGLIAIIGLYIVKRLLSKVDINLHKASVFFNSLLNQPAA